MVIVCLGEALIDLVPPAGQSPGSATNLAVQPGGAPLNICVGLNRLGRESAFLGCLSSDSFGQRLAGLLEREGIPRLPGGHVPGPTRLAVVDHTSVDAPFRFYGDSPADGLLTRSDVDAALQLPGISGLYVSSLMLTAGSGRDVQIYAMEQAIDRNLPVYSDPNPRPPAWSWAEDMTRATVYLLERSTLAKLSIEDARALDWPDDPETLFEWWDSRFEGDLLLTGGAAGCWMSVAGNVVHIRPPGVAVIDPTGAGDASFAALIARLHGAEGPSEQHLRFAAASGALATLKHGAIAALPTAEQVEAFVDGWKG